MVALGTRGGYVLDVVLRNNGTDEAHPWGLFHPGPQWHHVKKENIGLIEIMGLAILPPRVLDGFPDVCECADTRRELGDAYAAILQATGVFHRDADGVLTAGGEQALDAFLDFWARWRTSAGEDCEEREERE